jgi:hypothetical protein
MVLHASSSGSYKYGLLRFGGLFLYVAWYFMPVGTELHYAPQHGKLRLLRGALGACSFRQTLIRMF